MGFKRLIKNFRELGIKKFFKRWLEGIEGITPLQQTVTTLLGVIIVVVGILYGIVVTLIGAIYWMVIILGGSLIIVTIQFISTWQKYKKFKEVNRLMKEIK